MGIAPRTPTRNPTIAIIFISARPTRLSRSTLFSSPTLGERRHRGLARRLVAVCWRAILMMPRGERPQPRRIYWRGGCSHDAANHDAVSEHVEIVVTPFAGWTACRCVLEEQRFGPIRGRLHFVRWGCERAVAVYFLC
jgi:hypothetical protein